MPLKTLSRSAPFVPRRSRNDWCARYRSLDHELGVVQLLEVAVAVFVGAELLLLVAELVLGRK